MNSGEFDALMRDKYGEVGVELRYTAYLHYLIFIIFTCNYSWMLQMLKDRFSRLVTHARLSVTNRCNYSCIYCHREGLDYSTRELSPEDWDFFIKIAIELGIKYYKVTGGEPLLYDGIVDVLTSIRKYGGISSITTNGYLLKEFAESLSKAGVDHTNVSLHSLRREVFAALTGYDALDKVLAGIREALGYGIKLKINYLVLRPNLSEALNLLDFASSNGIDVNLIELIPLGVSKELYEELHVGLDNVINHLEVISIKKYIEPFQNRTVYTLPTGIKVYVIKGYGNPLMCAGCSRIRIGPDGKIKLCLYREIHLDLGPLIKERNEAEVRKTLVKAIEVREPHFR